MNNLEETIEEYASQGYKQFNELHEAMRQEALFIWSKHVGFVTARDYFFDALEPDVATHFYNSLDGSDEDRMMSAAAGRYTVLKSMYSMIEADINDIFLQFTGDED